jgi:hypothetical protein
MKKTGIIFFIATSVLTILSANAGSSFYNMVNRTVGNCTHNQDASSLTARKDDELMTAEETRRKYFSRPSPNYQLYSSMNTAIRQSSYPYQHKYPDNFFWLFNALKERGLRDVVGGAAQPQITLEGIASVELVTPPLNLRTCFQNTVFPIFNQAWLLDSQIQNLRRTRDLLLPRLLSGQINVEAAEHV